VLLSRYWFGGGALLSRYLFGGRALLSRYLLGGRGVLRLACSSEAIGLAVVRSSVAIYQAATCFVSRALLSCYLFGGRALLSRFVRRPRIFWSRGPQSLFVRHPLVLHLVCSSVANLFCVLQRLAPQSKYF
jgi:hypothetical protein